MRCGAALKAESVYSTMKKHVIYRWTLHLIGLMLVAIGMTVNTKTGLGVAATMSLPFTIAQLTNISLGDITLCTYVMFILLQMVLHTYLERKRGIPASRLRWLKDAAEFLVAIGVSRIINVISAWMPPLGEGLAGPFWDSIPVRIVVLVCAFSTTGIGAAITINMRLIPNPVDGLVHAIADCLGKTVGFTKNCFDLLNVILSVPLALLFKGKLIGLGIGTFLSMVGCGRVISLFNQLFSEKICHLAGLEPDATAKKGKAAK